MNSKRLFFASLVNEHHWDVVHDWIDTTTSCASKAVLLIGHCDRLFAGGADEDIEQFFGNRHG